MTHIPPTASYWSRADMSPFSAVGVRESWARFRSQSVLVCSLYSTKRSIFPEKESLEFWWETRMWFRNGEIKSQRNWWAHDTTDQESSVNGSMAILTGFANSLRKENKRADWVSPTGMTKKPVQGMRHLHLSEDNKQSTQTGTLFSTRLWWHSNQHPTPY